MQMNDMILISVDDHIAEPPSCFDGVPAALRDKAPKIINKDGVDAWVYEDRVMPNFALNAVCGRPLEEYGFEPTGYHQMRKSAYDPVARLEDMAADGVFAAVNYSTVVGATGAIFLEAKDKKVAEISCSAYNDWHIDEWCGADPTRFIPLGILPLWDVNLAVAEARRLARRGVHALSFPDNAVAKGLPSIHSDYWDPLFSVMQDNGMVINSHIGTGFQAPHAGPESPIDAWITTMPMSIANAAADWLFSPVFKKFTSLKICLAEGGVGWVPYLLERADFVYRHHKAWTNSDFGNLTPREMFFRNFLTCFISDDFGMKNIDEYDIDTVCWECDYPHSDSVWPHSAEAVWSSVKNLPDAAIDKITHLNVMREFHFDPFATRDRATARVGALRESAKHVETAPKANLGGFDPATKKKGEPVTSAEVQRMFVCAL